MTIYKVLNFYLKKRAPNVINIGNTTIDYERW